MRWFSTLIAVLLLGLAVYFASQSSSDDPTQTPAQGEVLSVQGQVMGRSMTNEKKVEELKAKSLLSPPMMLITGLDSEVSLIFGENFRVFSQSSLLLEKVGPKFRVHLLKGRLQRIKISPNVEFIVNNMAADSEKLELKALGTNSEDETNESPMTSATEEYTPQLSDEETNSDMIRSPKDPSQTLAETNIKKPQEQKLLQETLSLHQRFLEKCFIQHFERLKGQTQAGQILMKFVIQKDGRLRDVNIKKSPYRDKAFHQCLIAVMKRVRIKKVFDQDTPVEFPLQISIP